MNVQFFGNSPPEIWDQQLHISGGFKPRRRRDVTAKRDTDKLKIF